MTREEVLKKLSGRAKTPAVVLSALVILVGLYAFPHWLDQTRIQERIFERDLIRALEQTAAAREHIGSLEALKVTDLEELKAGISGNALSQKSLFESGLSLQEERRLLEKQLEIMTTTLLINPALQRIFLLRADQPLQSYLISYFPVRAFGRAPETLPSSVRITSKERFAHPERG